MESSSGILLCKITARESDIIVSITWYTEKDESVLSLTSKVVRVIDCGLLFLNASTAIEGIYRVHVRLFYDSHQVEIIERNISLYTVNNITFFEKKCNSAVLLVQLVSIGIVMSIIVIAIIGRKRCFRRSLPILNANNFNVFRDVQLSEFDALVRTDNMETMRRCSPVDTEYADSKITGQGRRIAESPKHRFTLEQNKENSARHQLHNPPAKWYTFVEYPFEDRIVGAPNMNKPIRRRDEIRRIGSENMLHVHNNASEIWEPLSD